MFLQKKELCGNAHPLFFRHGLTRFLVYVYIKFIRAIRVIRANFYTINLLSAMEIAVYQFQHFFLIAINLAT